MDADAPPLPLGDQNVTKNAQCYLLTRQHLFLNAFPNAAGRIVLLTYLPRFPLHLSP